MELTTIMKNCELCQVFVFVWFGSRMLQVPAAVFWPLNLTEAELSFSKKVQSFESSQR